MDPAVPTIESGSMGGKADGTKKQQANGPTPKDLDDRHRSETPDMEEMVAEGATPGRGQWGRKMEFILTLVGYAVGLGNIWRFPYLAYSNGGGAFLIPYVLMLLLVGVPCFFMELALGQFSSLGPVAAFRMSPLLRGVGVAAVITNAYIVLYFNVIIAWAMYFFFSAMAREVPWKTCNNWWNTDACFEGTVNASATNMTNVTVSSPSEEFFYNKVLQMSPGIEYSNGIVWQLALILLCTWVIVFLVLVKGISSLGKASYVVSIFPYVLLTVMLVRGSTLIGATEGVKFYIRPNFTRLRDVQVWGDAATQICYSVGISLGNLIAMASFNNFHNNVRRDSMLIPVINCGTSLYGGFVIFSVLGFMAQRKGVPIDRVVASGPGLVFVVYPEGLAQMPVAPMWSCLFFLMMSTLGFSSQFSAMESIVCVFLDEFETILRRGRRPMILRAIMCLVFFLLGLPLVTRGGFYLFQILNDFSAGYSLLCITVLELVCVHYIYGHSKFSEDISLMIGSRPGIYWQATWRFISPLVVVAIIVLKATNEKSALVLGDYVYPRWATALAWLIVAFPLSMVFFLGLAECLKKGGYISLKAAAKPEPDWGPARAQDRVGSRYEIKDRRRRHVVSSVSEASRSSASDINAYESVYLNTRPKEQEVTSHL